MSNTGYFAVVLVGMTLTAVSGLAQHRYYSRTVRRLAAAHDQPGSVLISGRGKGQLRGAVVVLVLRKDDEVIQAASVMEGATVLARFADRTEWIGLSARGELPGCSSRAATAVTDALSRVPGRKRPVPVPRTRLARPIRKPTRTGPAPELCSDPTAAS